MHLPRESGRVLNKSEDRILENVNISEGEKSTKGAMKEKAKCRRSRRAGCHKCPRRKCLKKEGMVHSQILQRGQQG